MKTATLERSGISKEVVALVSRLVDLILGLGLGRRCAMGDVILSLLDGKHRVAEDVFGWNRSTVEVGINEFKTGMTCINDLSLRLKPAAEVKKPKLLADIIAIMESQRESESSLRTTLLYIHMTAKVV